MGRADLLQEFPDGRFGSPATQTELNEAEAVLGVSFPAPLRSLYLSANGFSPGHVQYLSPLPDLVSFTQFMWRELPSTVLPGMSPDFTPFVFFGSSSTDYVWGIRCKEPHDIISWHHHMLDEGGYESAGAHIIDVYRADFAYFEAIRSGLKDA